MPDTSPDDRWTTTVHLRMDQVPYDPDLCKDGSPHDFASGECSICGAEDPFEDRPTLVHPYDGPGTHLCFAGCRHESSRRY